MVVPEQDRFQLLPNNLVEAILCKVGSVKWLLRCEAVCKRWNRLCSCVDELVFDCTDFQLMEGAKTISLETHIWRTLSSHMFRVRSLRILKAPVLGIDVLPSWLKLSSAHLEFLHLDFSGNLGRDKVLPDKVYFQRLVHLGISCCRIEKEPSCFMPCLTSCSFWRLRGHTWIEKFAQLSPLLKNMKLLECSYSKLCIASQSLETLVARGNCPAACLEIEAPRLSHLEIQNVKKLVVTGAQQALDEFVLWSGVDAEFCSMPRVSRWIFKEGWTCEGTVRVLKSVKHVEIGHVQLSTPLYCDDPRLNRTTSKGVHLVCGIGQAILQALRAGTYHLVSKDSLQVSRLESLWVVVEGNFDNESCDALELLLNKCGLELKLVKVFCDKTASSCRLLTKVARLQRRMGRVEFCWMNKRDIESASSAANAVESQLKPSRFNF